jgi:hypothetical protein
MALGSSAQSGHLTVGSSTYIALSSQLGVQITAAGRIGQVIRGAASQTANLQEWQNSAGTSLAHVTSIGSLRLPSIGSTASGQATMSTGNSGGFAIFAVNAANKPFMIQGAASQTANLQELQSNASVVLGGRNANAQIFTGSTAPLTTAVGGATTAASGDGTTATLTTTSNHNLAVGDRITVAGVTPTGYNGTFIVTAAATNSVSYANATTGAQTVAGTVSVDAQSSVTARSAGTIGMIVRGAASQSANLQEWQNSAGSVLCSINSTGRVIATYGVTVAADIVLGNGGVNTTAENVYTYRVTPNTGTPTVPVMVVRLRPSQTANIQEWQDSSSNILARVDYLGNIIAPARVYVGVGATAITSTKLPVVIDNTTFVGVVIRGSASQTGNLQEWQNSAGTILTRVSSNGSIFGGGNITANNGIIAANGFATLNLENSGGYLSMYKGTAAAANPGANQAKLYFRDGTTAGTLKLAVRAGTAGVETTLIDNIDQTGTDTSLLGVKFIDGGSA